MKNATGTPICSTTVTTDIKNQVPHGNYTYLTMPNICSFNHTVRIINKNS